MAASGVLVLPLLVVALLAAPGAIAVAGEVQPVVVAGPAAATVGYATPIVVASEGSGATFTNADAAGHDVVSVDKDADGQRLFRSALVGTGATSPIAGVEVVAPGTYPFICSVHPLMRGTLEVR